MTPLLELNNVSYAYHSRNGETYALSDLNFQVQRGEFIAVVGPSGCGKSTLLSLISGLLLPESGSILFEGREDNTFREKIGYMLQKDHLFEWRTIYGNVTLGLEIQNRLNVESRMRIDKMLMDYGLYRFRNARPSELSGGMRQRAALIRTLALEPELLLLDEPFSALDFQTRLTVCDDVASILRKEKKTAILVTHDLSEAVSMADRIIVLTKRPARIRSILELNFEEKNLTPFGRRNTPEFKDYFNLLWKELNDDGKKKKNVNKEGGITEVISKDSEIRKIEIRKNKIKGDEIGENKIRENEIRENEIRENEIRENKIGQTISAGNAELSEQNQSFSAGGDPDAEKK